VLNRTLFQDNQDKVIWGTADTYKPRDGSKHILYSQDLNYAYRGIALEQLSLLEYCCIIDVQEVEEISEKSEKESNKYQKEKNTSFQFQYQHPLYVTHVQKIRSKFYIPLLAGAQPPNINFFNVNNTSFSTLSESNQAEARRCALY
jgi:glutathionyl-hydroquinone reductase